MGEVLRTEKLCAGYGGKVVVEGVELKVESGRVLTLIGPNGAGKSTLLRTIVGALRPAAGVVTLDGRDLREFSERERARSMSVLMTGRPAPELTTCQEVVGAGRYPYTGALGVLNGRDRAEVERAMELTGISALAEREFTRLSDGERQLVMLARAVCQRPRVLVLDEPTSFLDIRHKLAMLAVIRELAGRDGVAVVMSLHELDLAEKVSDIVVCVSGGKIDRVGPPEEIFTGGYIERVYRVERGGFNDVLACPELAAPEGEPRVFAVGGGGRGIPFYRALQRAGVAFAAGIIFENDLDMAVAGRLGREIVTCPAFAAMTGEQVERAKAAIDRVEAVVDCGCPVGELNLANGELLEYARAGGKRIITEIREIREAFL